MIEFKCYGKENNKKICWNGSISVISSVAYCIHIESRSGFDVYLFKDVPGYVISIPVFNFGADLSSDLGDTFYNSEKLIPGIGYVDGITVVYALNALNEYLNMTP